MGMETKATWKRVGKAVLAIVLVIALSAGTALFIHRRSGVSAAATVKNGLSAYELAVAEGYSGTTQEWLASLRGQSAYALAKAAGYTGSESDWAARLAKLAQSDPVSLTAANFNNRGQLILTLSDGTTLNLGNAVGENGKNGSDGRNGTDGKNGADGKDGKDGLDGISVSGVDLTDAGELVLRFSDDRMVNVGRVTGAQGIQGEKGEKGDTGAQGVQGEKGEKGDTGAQGAQGEKGEKGDTGAQGVQGEKGEKGDTGAQGAQGEKGEKGDTGAQGAQGEKGEKGDTGAQGAQGEKGEKGDTGAQGAQGEKGEKGAAGAAGNGIQTIRLVDGTMTVELTDGSKFTFENVRGENGADGVSPQVRINAATNLWEISADEGENWVSTGVQATGARGEAGAPGEKGEKGDKGDPGQNGVSPRVMIDPASREWKISTDNGLTWTKTGISAIGEKGEKGDTGAQGAQGEKGEKGDTGAQGAQGEKGEKGDTGAQGTQGEKGEKGDTGAQGAQGEKGEKGDTGAQGIQGEKGEKGDTGVSVTGVTLEDYKLVVTLSDGTVLRLEQSLLGATGAKGDTGAQGAQGVQGEKGEKGDPGAAGRGIDRVVLTAEGCLIFEYSDGTKSEPTASLMGAQGAKGDKGDTGADGRGIVTVSLDGGDLYVTYSDSATPVRIGTVQGEKGDKGDPGAQGEKGDTGVDGKSAYELYRAAYPDYTGTLTEWLASLKGDTGRGIQKAEIVDGKLIVTYTDGTQEDFGSITAGDPSASPDDYFVFTLLADGTYGVGISETHKTYVRKVVIPSVHNGKAVTMINRIGFQDCKNLTNVTFPDSLTTIGPDAFNGCTELREVFFPNSLTTLCCAAFDHCENLTAVHLPTNPNFTMLGTPLDSTVGSESSSWAFGWCYSLKKLYIPKNITYISFNAFVQSGLEELEFEDPTGWVALIKHGATTGKAMPFGEDAKANAQLFMKYTSVSYKETYIKRFTE